MDRDALRTVVQEFGAAFEDTGEDLGQIIDTTTSFIETADANFDLTTALIRSSNTVLTSQVDLASSIRSFTRDLSLFSTTLAGADADLRTVIDNGSSAANTVRRFIEENDVDITSLLNNLRTTSEVIVDNLDGVEHLLAIYPYAVEGGFTVVAKDPDSGLYDAHFGLVLTPTSCVTTATRRLTNATRPTAPTPSSLTWDAPSRPPSPTRVARRTCSSVLR
ncbi:MCE family protein [Nocardioides alcanivorans]|uniref:MCE family protein n=1 Tax=Nocardioides alcanivorans TaxID=2897352 RepID=UPI001F30A394|nr:MCE family protein [Nocardioides alcanivorans]